MRNFVLLFVCMLLVTGCASMESNYRPAVQQSDFPLLNKTTTVKIGDIMLSQGKMMSVEFLQVLTPVDGVIFDIPEGLYPKRGYKDGKEYFSARGEMVDVASGTGVVPSMGMFISADKPNEICVINANSGFVCYDAPYKVITKQIPASDSGQKRLYFSGQKGNDIILMYTEQAKGQAMYTHNVTYNIVKNSIITYKGAEIKVIDCSNEKITYEVIKNFSNVSQQ